MLFIRFRWLLNLKLLKITRHSAEADISSSERKICELQLRGKGEEGGDSGWHSSTDWAWIPASAVGGRGRRMRCRDIN